MTLKIATELEEEDRNFRAIVLTALPKPFTATKEDAEIGKCIAI